jgi:hypothetical protein
MRIFEFAGDDNLDKFIIILKNFVGRAASKRAPAKLNWSALNRIAKSSGSEITADYETFKAIYDATPQVQSLVKNFNADGIELNVPGAPDAEAEPTQGQDQDSQAAVDQAAASAAPNLLAQSQATPKI